MIKKIFLCFYALFLSYLLFSKKSHPCLHVMCPVAMNQQNGRRASVRDLDHYKEVKELNPAGIYLFKSINETAKQ